jgi:RNA-dependent RNA polymerase
MGFFDEIKIVAKYAARLGQCFSTTRAITGTPITVLELGDVQHNGYDFTDGVGRMSPFIAKMISLELNLPCDDPPSVFQFRLGGCKGVLAVHPEVPQHHLKIRKSQYKFAAQHLGLEIIRWSQFAAASLNRQLILVLSALGVEDQVFLEKQDRMLARLELAMSDERIALDMLQKNVDPNGMTMTISSIIGDGFMKSRDPFILSLLQLWRAWSIKYLKEKAKIMIENGAFVLGCIDESRTLKGWFQSPYAEKGFLRERERLRPFVRAEASPGRISTLPEIFIQVSDHERPGSYKIIQGLCLVARNPSLHPGDIRVVNAVDSPLLHHLRDVVVFPQSGDRDIPSMCSGGDLDGDDYIVMWDQELIPKEWNHEPMDFTPPKPDTVDNVTVDDITSFFIRYMKNDKIGQIAHAHLAHADFEPDGVKSRNCKCVDSVR